MKHRFKILLVLSLALAVAGATVILVLVYNSNDTGTGTRPVKRTPEQNEDAPAFTRNKPIHGKINNVIKDTAGIPKTMNVYECSFPLDTPEKVKEMAARFGLNGEVEVMSGSSPSFYRVRQGEQLFVADLEMERFYYSDQSVGKIPPPTPPVIPTEEEAKEMARRDLERLGLMPPDAFVAGIGGESAGNKDYTAPSSIEVIFSRRLDGYEVHGPGMAIRVEYGDGKKLKSVRSSMRDLKLVGSYKVISVDEALKRAEAGKETINLYSNVKNPTVTSVIVLYYADNVSSNNHYKYLKPMYGFTGPDACIYVPMIVGP